MLEAEKGAIACMLLDNTISLSTKLRPEHFTDSTLRKCFEVIYSHPGEKVEPTTLSSKVGISFEDAWDIESFTISASGYSQYEDIIIDSYIYRKYKEISDTISREASSGGSISKIKELVSDLGSVGVENIQEETLVAGSINTAMKILEGDMQSFICDFGFSDLDTYLKGYRRGNLITIGARTGVGKSTFALNLISKAVVNQKRCCLFSSEMLADEIRTRFIAHITGITQYQLESGSEKVSDELTDKLGDRIKGLSDCVIYDKFGDFKNLCNLIRKEALNGTELFFVDYLQNITNNSKFSLKTHIIGEMSSTLKKLSLELGVSIVQLAQLNRESSKDSNKLPRKEHLRESGDIEQDSDVILLLHDESMYDQYANDNRLMVIVAKNRNGKTLSFEMGITRKYFTIYDI